MLIDWTICLLQQVIIIHAYCQLYLSCQCLPYLWFLTKHSPEFHAQGQLESVWTLGYNEWIIEARNFQHSSCNFRKSIDFKCVVKISGNVQTFTGSSLISNNKLYEGSYIGLNGLKIGAILYKNVLSPCQKFN